MSAPGFGDSAFYRNSHIKKPISARAAAVAGFQFSAAVVTGSTGAVALSQESESASILRFGCRLAIPFHCVRAHRKP